LTNTLIDLFAGAGGMTLGFVRRGFRPVWANDFNQHAANTYNLNFGRHCEWGDIVDILEDGRSLPSADIVIGGPPCQGFSLLNKNRSVDPRKELWRPYLEVVRRSRAHTFVMENVPELLASSEFAAIIEAAEEIGFPRENFWFSKLCAADYGVPQARWRAIIVACKLTRPGAFFPPTRTHRNPRANGNGNGQLSMEADVRPWTTVRQFIGALEPPEGTEIRAGCPPPYDLHFGRTPTAMSVERYKAVANQGDNRFTLQVNRPDLTPDCWIRKKSGGTDLLGRLWWDRPAFTIRTEFFKPEKGRYLHPEQHRPITHREAALLQTFPPDFKFSGSKIEIARQIGNAVPPLFAEAIAGAVRAMLATC
jgi:DNA (cytosine-5)-methyltransferase 1